MPGFAISGGNGPSNTTYFHRQHRWRIVSLGIPTGVTISAGADRGARDPGSTFIRGSRSANAGGAASGGSRDPLLFAKTLELPSLSFDEESVHGASLIYKFAKTATWENLTVTFYDSFGLHEQLKGWQDRVWTAGAGIGTASNYMGEPQFALVDATGAISQQFKLINAYPKKVSHGPLSMASSDIKVLSITYSYHWAEITISDSARGKALDKAAQDAAAGRGQPQGPSQQTQNQNETRRQNNFRRAGGGGGADISGFRFGFGGGFSGFTLNNQNNF